MLRETILAILDGNQAERRDAFDALVRRRPEECGLEPRIYFGVMQELCGCLRDDSALMPERLRRLLSLPTGSTYGSGAEYVLQIGMGPRPPAPPHRNGGAPFRGSPKRNSH